MLALNSKFSSAILMTGLFMFLIGSAFGQQTPSQRYQPVRQSEAENAPPSVHVAPSNANRIAPQFRAVSQQTANGTGYSFSDDFQTKSSEVPNRNLRPQYEPPQRGTIQQTSYAQDEVEPRIPAILLGNAPIKKPGLPLQAGAAQFKTSAESATRVTPNDFAAGMSQLQSAGPRIAPSELSNQQLNINEQMAELRRRAEAKDQAMVQAQSNAQQTALAEKVAAEQREIARLEAEKQEAIRLQAERLAAAKAVATSNVTQQQADRQKEIQAEATRIASERMQAEKQTAERDIAEQRQLQRLKAEQAARDRIEREAEKVRVELAAAEAANEVSASDFIGGIAAKQPAHDSHLNTPKLLPHHLTPSTSNKVTSTYANKPVMDTNVRQVSSEVDANDAAIRLAAPAIEVETYGPSTIGINKPATYRIVVKNNSIIEADRILVGINLPQWVDIENVNMTTGGKEITDGNNQARLVWSIDKVPGNASQTITVTAVPRKAEMFDVGVEWTLVPRVGRANITVTEPKLEMTISGPPEVLYGETAIYHVTVRNPGTGAAENVIVMLPEALGGERATLGNIEAGKEKNFQVELLARTAGDLNLVATAAAEQELKTSAERALIVRRASLDVSLEGPGLKYAGSGAQYKVLITNNGDATAQDIVTAVALPQGVKYIGGIESVKIIEGGLRWQVGNLEPGQTRTYKVNCQLNTSGDLQLEVGARGKGDLAASSACLTSVETVADLVLTVADPKGPLPTGEMVPYEIKVQNRGSKSAKGVNLVMQFSEGIEPIKAEGLEYKIVPGQVLFSPITQIDPGQEMSFKITAEAMKGGTHIFRAQLTCQDSDAREIAEGTTRFFGEQIQRGTPATTADASETPASNSNDFGGNFKR